MGKMEGSIFVSGLKTGDAEAWRYLFVRYYAVYLRFITKIVGDMTSAEDIAQEVFLKLWKSRERLDSEASVEKLLYVIARNSAFTFLRDRKSFVQVEESRAADATLLSVEEELLQKERRKMLDDAVKSLPKQRKAVVDMKMGEPVRKVPYQPVPPLPKPCRRQIVIRNSDFSDRLGGGTNRSISEGLKLSEKTVERHITLALSELRTKFRS